MCHVSCVMCHAMFMCLCLCLCMLANATGVVVHALCTVHIAFSRVRPQRQVYGRMRCARSIFHIDAEMFPYMEQVVYQVVSESRAKGGGEQCTFEVCPQDPRDIYRFNNLRETCADHVVGGGPKFQDISHWQVKSGPRRIRMELPQIQKFD
jgi:hypothetical protein